MSEPGPTTPRIHNDMTPRDGADVTATRLLARLQNLSAAELFDALGLAYDPAVLRVARLHFMRTFAQFVATEALVRLPEADAAVRCRSHLESAYDEFVRSLPSTPTLFKVLSEPPKAPAERFVSVDVLEEDRLAFYR